MLTREVGQRLFIGGGWITICVLGVQGDQVKLGIVAPPHVAVDREEIAVRKARHGEAGVAGGKQAPRGSQRAAIGTQRAVTGGSK